MTGADWRKTVKVSKITLTVALEDYGNEAHTGLDELLNTLHEHANSELVILDYEEQALQLVAVDDQEDA